MDCICDSYVDCLTRGHDPGEDDPERLIHEDCCRQFRNWVNTGGADGRNWEDVLNDCYDSHRGGVMY